MWTIISRRPSTLTGATSTADIVAWSRLQVLVTSSPTYYSSKSNLEDEDENGKELRKNFKERLTDVKTAAKFVTNVVNLETDSYKMDKETKETIIKVKEAAETVKDGVNDVKKTTNVLGSMASSAADTVKKRTKDATDKVSDSAIKATSEIVKDKITNKFK